MSRLIIKNLPPKTTEEKLRKSFDSHGIITDVQLKFTKEGKFRHFAFIGYKTEDEAQRAQKYTNNTYFGASKIQVEVSADLGDADSKPRSWSKYATDSSAYQKLHKTEESEEVTDKKQLKSEKEKKKERKRLKKEKIKEVNALMDKYKNDPKFQEFLRVHQRNSTETWNNDAILQVGKAYEDEPEEENVATEEIQIEKNKEACESKLSDLDYLKTKGLKEDENVQGKLLQLSAETPQKLEKFQRESKIFFTVKLENLPCTTKKKDVKKFFGPNTGIKSIRVPRNIKGIAYVGFSSESQRMNAMKKDKSFMGSAQIRVRKYDIDQRQHEMQSKESKWKKQEASLEDLDETIGQSGRIFVRNLAYTATEDDLEGLFKEFGPLTEVNLPIDKITKQSKGFAFITFVIPENAVQAFTKLDGTTFQGRLLHLIPAKSANEEEEIDDNNQKDGNKNYKQKKADQLKKQAGSSHNWNTLFLGTSAVAELMSDQYNVEKRDVLLANGDTTAAVRLALGETQIVEDTRKFLESEGVKLDAFEGTPKKRSKTVILCKNLPAKTCIETIRNKFATHGELQRVVMPPNCPTCLVEFTEPTEARSAFRSIAYINFNGNPLYLEWAPEDTFSKPSDKTIPKKDNDATNDNPKDTEIVEENATLFVKNLNFSTTDTILKQIFEEHFGSGKIHEVTIAKKKDMKNPGQMLSMGYGFIQFKTSAHANEALKVMQHKMIDGHSIELKRSNRAESNTDQVKTARKTVENNVKGKESAKMVVRNVPFEAKTKEIQDIFSTFGQLKRVFLPEKVTGGHRGFAFVEFISKEEAKKAFDKLCHSTHLYGRRLVLEWASEEETLETLRKRTANQYVENEPSKKKFKKSNLLESVESAA